MTRTWYPDVGLQQAIAGAAALESSRVLQGSYTLSSDVLNREETMEKASYPEYTTRLAEWHF